LGLAAALGIAAAPTLCVAEDGSAVITVTGRAASAAGPSVSPAGANDYAVSNQDIEAMPMGGTSPMTDVLAQMPGVAIDQNQQIHIRDTEGPQFQYQINGVMVPFDINTNPPFLSMINPSFVKRLDLLDGVLPSRYSYATGGVVDIETKDGCAEPGGSVTVLAGGLETLQPGAQFGGCAGRFSYYVSGLYHQGDDAFSSATPGPRPIHDFTRQGQAFGFFALQLDPATRLSLVLSGAASDNQLPNVAGQTPQFVLAGVPGYASAAIKSQLNFRDSLAMLSLTGAAPGGATYQLAYSAHFISQRFRPDAAGELIFQGVASNAAHYDVDNTLQGHLAQDIGAHSLEAGFYLGEYRVTAEDSSLVFPVSADGVVGDIPERRVANARATNGVTGVYLNDLWKVTDRLSANLGLRWDRLSGFTNHQQIDPTLNLIYALSPSASLHAGVARYMQVPSFQGIAPNTAEVFFGTTAAQPSGIANPLTEDDLETDAGVSIRIGRHVTLSQDAFFESTSHYLDTGQFGVVPIFAPFNYGKGHIWGEEVAVRYRDPRLSAYANLTLGQNWQKGVATGQFNFDPDELSFIDDHAILLDHQPFVGISAGGGFRVGPYQLSLDGVYSSGLRGGFADQQQLPTVVEVNAAVERRFRLPWGGVLVDRLTVVNALDRINLIRPAEGIGIFQSAYGPRLAVFNSLTMPF